MLQLAEDHVEGGLGTGECVSWLQNAVAAITKSAAASASGPDASDAAADGDGSGDGTAAASAAKHSASGGCVDVDAAVSGWAGLVQEEVQ